MAFLSDVPQRGVNGGCVGDSPETGQSRAVVFQDESELPRCESVVRLGEGLKCHLGD